MIDMLLVNIKDETAFRDFAKSVSKFTGYSHVAFSILSEDNIIYFGSSEEMKWTGNHWSGKIVGTLRVSFTGDIEWSKCQFEFGAADFVEDYCKGFNEGFDKGWTSGCEEGMNSKRISRDEYERGYKEGFDDGFENGYADGYERGERDIWDWIEVNNLKIVKES